MILREFVAQHQQELKIHQYGFTTTDQLSFGQEVRDLCEANSCGRYGRSWSCPPGVGSLESCKAKIMEYKNVFVYTTKHELEDSFDFEGMMQGKEDHEKISRHLLEAVKPFLPGDHMAMTGGSCSRCEPCTYPDAPCRFPEELTPTIESYGIRVNQLAQTVDVNYINGANTVTYFGCIIYGKQR